MAGLQEKDAIIDLLKRASEMEESMASSLVDICNDPSSIDGIEEPKRTTFINMLGSIKEDTLRHKKTVKEILLTYEGKLNE